MTVAAATGQVISAACPRCGYDQRGVISTWKDSCPLQGTCTECGLEFIWCELLRPEKFEPRWCIEFEPKKRRLLWAALRTYFRSFVPWQFWSRLKMSDAIHWWRLLMYVLLMLLPLLLLYIGAQGGLALYVRMQIEEELAQEAKIRPAAIQNMQSILKQFGGLPAPGDTSPQAQRVQSQVNYYNAEIARMQAMGTAPEYIDSSWLATTWEALTQPISSISSANVVSPSGMVTRMYVPPIALLSVAGRNMSRNDWVEAVILPAAWLAWGVGITLLLPLSFILMPLSLRKAKVRWAHLIRVTAYSVFIPVTCVALALLIGAPAAFLESEAVMEMLASAVRYVPWLAVALWWHAATSRYLKIPHAWLTISMLTLMCLLIMLGITATISQGLAWQMLDLFEPLIR